MKIKVQTRVHSENSDSDNYLNRHSHNLLN